MNCILQCFKIVAFGIGHSANSLHLKSFKIITSVELSLLNFLYYSVRTTCHMIFGNSLKKYAAAFAGKHNEKKEAALLSIENKAASFFDLQE